MDRLAHPLRVVDGRLARVDQHSADHADQQVRLVRTTRPGDRTAQPRIGMADPAGQSDAVIAELLDVAIDAQVTAGRRTGPTVISRPDPTTVVATTPVQPRRR